MSMFHMNKQLKWNADVLEVTSTVSADFQNAINECTKKFEDTVTSMVVDHFECDFSDFREYLHDKEEWRRKQEQAIPKWIPASNPPKKTCEDVLCYDEDGDVVMGYYVDEECGWYSKGAFRIFPTHWMPLPKGPDADVTAE